jgi:hypothetical protein
MSLSQTPHEAYESSRREHAAYVASRMFCEGCGESVEIIRATMHWCSPLARYWFLLRRIGIAPDSRWRPSDP